MFCCEGRPVKLSSISCQNRIRALPAKAGGVGFKDNNKGETPKRKLFTVLKISLEREG